MEPISGQPDDQVDFDLATLGARLAARVVDTLIGVAVFFTLFAILVGMGDIEIINGEEASYTDRAAYVLQWIPVVIWGLYEVPLLTSRGQTLGKMVTKIKVIASEGDGPPRRNPALARWAILAAPPMLLPNFGLLISLGVGMWFAFDSRRQGLHDKAARTFVVKVAPLEA